MWPVCWRAVLFCHTKGLPAPAALCTGENLVSFTSVPLMCISVSMELLEDTPRHFNKNNMIDSTPSIRTNMNLFVHTMTGLWMLQSPSHMTPIYIILYYIILYIVQMCLSFIPLCMPGPPAGATLRGLNADIGNGVRASISKSATFGFGSTNACIAWCDVVRTCLGNLILKISAFHPFDSGFSLANSFPLWTQQ